jgi:hypothetical protein
MSGSRTQLEQILELLLNEENKKAEELLHEYVVAKAREEYEKVLDEADDWEDDADDFAEEIDDEEIGEAEEDDEDTIDQTNDFEDDVVDAGDDMDDVEMDIDDAETESGDDDFEDRVEDLEAELEDLRAEFERLMGGDDMGGDDMDMGGDDMDMGGDDMDMGGDDMDMGGDDDEIMDSVEYDLDEADFSGDEDDYTAPDVGDVINHKELGRVKVIAVTGEDTYGGPAEYRVKTQQGKTIELSHDELVGAVPYGIQEATTFSKKTSEQPMKGGHLKGSEADNNQSPYTNAPKPSSIGTAGDPVKINNGGEGKKDHGGSVKKDSTHHNMGQEPKAAPKFKSGAGNVDGSNKTSPLTKIKKPS